MIYFYRKDLFEELCESNLCVGVPLDERQCRLLNDGFEWDSSAPLIFGGETTEAFAFFEPFARCNPPPRVTQLFLDRLAAIAVHSHVGVSFHYEPLQTNTRVRGPAITLEIT